MKNIIYIHGFRSSGQGSSKVNELKSWWPDVEVIAPDLPVHDGLLMPDAIKELMANTDDIIGVIGTSMGGFWARYLSNEYGVKAMAINPSLEPWATLPLGEAEVYGQDRMIEVTESGREALKEFAVEKGVEMPKCKHVVALDDELLSVPYMLDYLGSDTITFDDGGHRFEGFDRLQPIMEQHFNLSYT